MVMATTGLRRSNVEIVYDMLCLCRKGRFSRTAVMYGSNLSYAQFATYMTFLTERHFIASDGSGRLVITETGNDALRQMAGVVDLLSKLRSTEELERRASLPSPGPGLPHARRVRLRKQVENLLPPQASGHR
ncbi:MAG: hypothetical protein HYY01_13550 [Chloroflexi bacterium]|nr:hypothetical protein [Chloroflexota bacterium]